jgi:hypothetical protein
MQLVYVCPVKVDIPEDNMVTNIVQDVSEQQEVSWTTLKRLADEGTVSIEDYLMKVPEILN